MASSYQICKALGIPIRVHISLLLLLPIFAVSMGGTSPLGLLLGGIAATGLFTSVALHELGHSWVAQRKGCHIQEILLLPIGGLARLAKLPEHPRDEMQVAIAGPLVSLGLGIAGILAARPLAMWVHPVGAVLAYYLGRINIGLALFNLIPSFPMDGGRIFRAYMTPRLGRLRATWLAARIGRGIAWLFALWAFYPIFHGQTPDFFLLFIAYFIHQAAGGEARMVSREEWMRRQHGGSPGNPAVRQLTDEDVTVGSPTYPMMSPSSSDSSTQPPWLDDLNRWS